MAGHKVILVDQEEKANSATRDLNHCQGILESRDQELKESRSHIEELAKDVEMYRTSIVDYKDELKRKVAANNALAKKLGIAQKQVSVFLVDLFVACKTRVVWQSNPNQYLYSSMVVMG